MTRIGRPLFTTISVPKVIPVPKEVPAPVKVPEKEKVPVHVGTPAEDKAYATAETAIQRVAQLLGVSDDWVVGKVLEVAGWVERVLDLGYGQENPFKVDSRIHPRLYEGVRKDTSPESLQEGLETGPS